MENDPKARPHFEGHLTNMMKRSCIQPSTGMIVSFSLANTLAVILVKYHSLNGDSSTGTRENSAKRINLKVA